MSADGPGTPSGPLRMINAVRGYDWGSRERLAAIQGRPPSEQPEAELWMGTHPGAPSQVETPSGVIGLPELIAADPAGTLGPDVAARFGARLPFLLKILAIEKALSIQVHPDAAQARSGFDGGSASYVDPYPKPEMAYAVSDVEALAGLRPASAALELLDLLDVPALDDVRRVLREGDAERALGLLADWPREDREGLARTVDGAASSALGSVRDPEHVHLLEWVRRLGVQHPGDPLVVAPLLMTLLRFAPGEAFFVPAGVPHAYLTGTAVEIMSESDNVVRAGLTPKAVDVATLLELLVPGGAPLLGVPQVVLSAAETVFRPPVEHFELVHGQVDGVVAVADLPGPQVVLCLRGEVEVEAAGVVVTLSGGESAFVPAGARPVVVRGRGEVFRALPAGNP